LKDTDKVNLSVRNKEQIHDKLIEGIVNYFQVRKNHLENHIELPNSLHDNNITIYFGEKQHKIDEHGGIISHDKDGRRILEDYNMLAFNEDNIASEESKRIFKQELIEELRNADTMPIEILRFLGYAYKRSFISLSFDDKTGNPEESATIIWEPCYSDMTVVNGKVSYPYVDIKNYTSILLCVGAHYFLIENNDINKKKQFIETVIQSSNDEWQSQRITQLTIQDGVIKRITRGGFKKLQKQTTITYKNKLRNSRFTTNMKKHKLRKPKYSIKNIKQPKKTRKNIKT
jgi:hypothetical protein